MGKLLLVIFSIVAFIIPYGSVTFAWWNNKEEVKQETLTIGTWDFIIIWEPNTDYEEGTVVFHNGSLWIRNSRASSSVHVEPSLTPPGRNLWDPYN